ncbi:hypothetical protein [Pseudosulfitobacter koreensis]|uniref:Uncharacterized protein n=1 Tax=Pseudosulfitobacter koreensis TaxID=2968472 RepID=A0ABT1Z432_9RHOB|nr:hypothetical protein [Pseudosulfitobacter koreense]MCR8827884.1 hypothetical protein [Pseudosulfitobacter koreense]
MPNETAARCVLQEARDRRLSVYPDEFGLKLDICDVTLWIRQKFRLPSVHVWVDRHYVHRGKDISGVTVILSPALPDPLTTAAREAFLALGYDIEDTGADIYGHPPCDGFHSRHEAIHAFGRIESVLRSWRSL